MEKNAFYNLFTDLLKEAFDFENQIVENLPLVIKNVANEELKGVLSQHLDETKLQVQRLKKVFKALNENPTGTNCQAIRSMLMETKDWLSKAVTPATKDAYLIIACQKVEHYEITCYGSLCALANCLKDWQKDDRIDFDDIIDILQESLDEEKDADEKLTDIAEGGFFTTGINEEARYEAEQATPSKKKSK